MGGAPPRRGGPHGARLVLEQAEEGLAVPALAQRFREPGKLLVVDVALAIGDLLDAADLESLPLLDDPDEVAGLHQGGEAPGVQPCRPLRQHTDLEGTAAQVLEVDVGDLQLTPGARSKAAG